MCVNHYKWLDKHLPKVFDSLGLNWDNNAGIVVAHGDKCYGMKHDAQAANIPFPHAVAVYLLTYVQPYSKEVRQTPSGWVDPHRWVINNYSRFVDVLPPVDHNDPDTMDMFRL